MDFSQRELELAIAASMGEDVQDDIAALQAARQGVQTTSNKSEALPAPTYEFRDNAWQIVAPSQNAPSVEDQLAERRERLAKRKYNDEEPPIASSSIPSSYKRASPSVSTAATGSRETLANRQDSPSEDMDEEELDMLLDGLDMDEALRDAISNNPALKADLIRQMGQAQLGNLNARDGEQADMEEEDDGMPRYKQMDADLGEALMQAELSRILRSPLGYSFPNGALRITRTPGRQDAPNCISIEELIDKKTLQSACIYAYMIGDPHLFQHLPVGPDSTVPLFIGRDVNMDPLTKPVLAGYGIKKTTGRVTKAQMHTLRKPLQAAYATQYGENFHAFYPGHCQGCAHSKLMVLIFPTFARLVITSSNLIDLDMVHSDNHWYIHDLPRFASNKALKVNTAFEKLFTVHLKELGVPASFFDKHFSGRFDFSSVRVSLITSRPGSTTGLLAESSGLLRLRKVVGGLDGALRSEMLRDGVKLEYCAGSIGWMEDKWLKEFYDCAIGKTRLKLSDYGCEVPDVSIPFPTFEDVESCDVVARKAASNNIGCHMNWGTAREEIKAIFSHYLSKDTGKLFHAKLLLALNPSSPSSALPYYAYMGSHNFSKSAWGRLAKVKDGNREDATRGLKGDECVNLECGVLIPRDVLEDLLEPGSTWHDIVPYHRPAEPYDLEKDESRPFKPHAKEEKGAAKERE